MVPSQQQPKLAAGALYMAASFAGMGHPGCLRQVHDIAAAALPIAAGSWPSGGAHAACSPPGAFHDHMPAPSYAHSR